MWACATPRIASHEPRGPDVRLSLLALGDWGRIPKAGASPPKQLRVGEALAEEDRRAPADALVFVGDNFYPHGLEAAELEPRLRANLVGPYCHFLQLSDLGVRALGDACPEPESRRHPLPLWAVLGNHDHYSPAAIELESRRIPDYVPNWRLLGLPVETLELPQGVSLIFYDSTALRLPSGASHLPLLTKALRESRGPWRILVAHHPIDFQDASHGIEGAIADSGARAQLLLVGHIHDLRAGRLEPPLPALQLISGGGGAAESNHKTLPDQLWQLKSTGFARIDLVGAEPADHLRLRVFAVSATGDEPGVVAAWTVSRGGEVAAETLAPERR
ncbi:MAG TPA: metallophosphoesterase [Myxococcota bacterium]|nr:metallophosphoesterase [Myxococcota bacterium]